MKAHRTATGIPSARIVCINAPLKTDPILRRCGAVHQRKTAGTDGALLRVKESSRPCALSLDGDGYGREDAWGERCSGRQHDRAPLARGRRRSARSGSRGRADGCAFGPAQDGAEDGAAGPPPPILAADPLPGASPSPHDRLGRNRDALCRRRTRWCGNECRGAPAPELPPRSTWVTVPMTRAPDGARRDRRP